MSSYLQTCKSFGYGGCKGRVPFKTKQACLSAKCANFMCTLEPKDVLPNLPPGTATCAAFWESWYYDKNSGKCKKFGYSGCSPVGPFGTKGACAGQCA